jgi:hypothetical protein
MYKIRKQTVEHPWGTISRLSYNEKYQINRTL